jgi:hypothetical protein
MVCLDISPRRTIWSCFYTNRFALTFARAPYFDHALWTGHVEWWNEYWAMNWKVGGWKRPWPCWRLEELSKTANFYLEQLFSQYWIWLLPESRARFCWQYALLLSQLRPKSFNVCRPATPQVVTGPGEPCVGHCGSLYSAPQSKPFLLPTHLVGYFLLSDTCLTTLFPTARRIPSSMSELSYAPCSRTPSPSLLAISGFHRETDENCAFLGYLAASSGNSLPTFRDKLSVPSSRHYWPLKIGWDW